MRRCRNERDGRLLPGLGRSPFDEDAPASPPPPIGTKFDANAACTPGSASTRATMSSTRLAFASGAVVLRAGQVEPHRHQRPRIEAERRGLEVEEAAHEQRRADEQHERQRDLDDDERAAEPGAGTAGVAAAALLEALLEVAARRLERRREPEDDAGQHRDGDRVDERARVEAPVDEVRHAVLRHPHVEQPDANPGKAHPDRRAEQPDGTASVSSCRTIRHRPAPSAARIEISRCRTDARASSRFATLAHAISSTSVTAPIIVTIIDRDLTRYQPLAHRTQPPRVQS